MERTPVLDVHESNPAPEGREGIPTGADGSVRTSTLPHLPTPSEPQGDRSHGSLPIEVRAVWLGDLPGLRRVANVQRLNQPEANLAPYSRLRAGLAACRRWPDPGRRFFVASAGDRIVGFADFRPVPPDGRWLLVALGAGTGVYDAAPVWEELVGHGIVQAGLSGVKRLYARLPLGAAVVPTLRGLGFAPYANETVLVAQDVRPRPAPRGLRAQEQSDTWAIHQLYSASVPRQVQYAEAFTSHRWDVGRRRRRPGPVAVAGWLIEEGHHVVGHVRTASREGNHVVELVYHPERVGLLDDLIECALAHVAAQGAKRVYCAVRGYQAEARTALEGRGFVPVLEQELHVKYTTAAVRLPAAEPVPFHVEVREKLPQRVPSFLHGQPRDETAT